MSDPYRSLVSLHPCKAVTPLNKYSLSLFIWESSLMRKITLPITSMPSASQQDGSVIMEQAQQEEKTNPYNLPAGSTAPKAETTTAPATAAPSDSAR